MTVLTFLQRKNMRSSRWPIGHYDVQPAPRLYRGHRLIPVAVAFVTMLIASACHDLSGLAGKQSLPSGVSDPNSVNTPAGAQQMYVGALYDFQYQAGNVGDPQLTEDNGAFVDYALMSGLLTDELQGGDQGGSGLAFTALGTVDSLDGRLFPEAAVVYGELQAVRKDGNQALGALAAYAPNASPALRGQLFAYEGYAEIMLADFFCSGVPLSTYDFGKDFTYQPGSTTTQVYQHAITLLDSAIALSTDSTRIEYLARIGKARALVDLGQYAEAAQLVTNIPDDFAYQFLVDWSGGAADGGMSLFGLVGSIQAREFSKPGKGATVANLDGVNGLPYISSGDPRTAVEPYDTNTYGVTQYAPVKYGATALSLTPITVASGVEARLIEAEAALHSSGSATWLTTLNALRTTGSFTVNGTDTTWNAGTGGVAGLRPLTDPGNDSARVTLLFNERAYWLFLTGQRQGDLRRLIRNYGRDPETVYPTGTYPLGGLLDRYGSDVSVQIPRTEFLNPLYRGCLSRGA